MDSNNKTKTKGIAAQTQTTRVQTKKKYLWKRKVSGKGKYKKRQPEYLNHPFEKQEKKKWADENSLH